MARANTDAHATTAIAMVQMSLGAQDPLRRAKFLSDAQMQLGWTLRAAVQDCQEAGMSWQMIGDALGAPKETIYRQFTAGGPVITAKPVHSENSPGATEMHRPATEAVYAFRTESGTWFGPDSALADGYTDGTLHFEPAQQDNAFAGQQLVMRFGPWAPDDVTVHACQVTLPGGMPRRVRVTDTVLDMLFGDGQTPLRQAVVTLYNVATQNPAVPGPLRAAIDRAADALGMGIPAGVLVGAVEKVVALAGLAVPDERVATALRRLERVVREYRAWAGAAVT